MKELKELLQRLQALDAEYQAIIEDQTKTINKNRKDLS
jgi:hypothetical protein